MKRFIAFLPVPIFLISGCTFNVQVLTPPPSAAASDTPPATQRVATPVATISSTVVPPVVGFTPTSSDPIFYAAYAVSDSRSAVGQSAFPAGTKQVFAIWTYQNMSEALIVKREWYLNGEPWLFREEPWDFAKYGEEGIIRDISIFEFENDPGLPSGVYQLRVYIDSLLQPIGKFTKDRPEMWLNFEILSGESIPEAASPDFQWDAAVLNGNHLIVRDVNGMPTDLFDGREIAYFFWFPDSQHILFVDRDRTGQQDATNRGIRDDLWIVDISARETNLVFESQAALGIESGFMISPDGRYVATSEGSGGGDACFVDLKLVFFKVGNDFRNVNVVYQEQFSGLPDFPDSTLYPSPGGTWQSDTEFMTPIKLTCSLEQSPVGYVFDVANLTVARE